MTWLNITTVNNHLATENTNDTLIRLPKQFIWENDSSQKFKTALQTRDIQRMIHDFLVDSRPDKHIRAIYTRKNKTRTVPFIRACLI